MVRRALGIRSTSSICVDQIAVEAEIKEISTMDMASKIIIESYERRLRGLRWLVVVGRVGEVSLDVARMQRVDIPQQR